MREIFDVYEKYERKRRFFKYVIFLEVFKTDLRGIKPNLKKCSYKKNMYRALKKHP